MKGVMFLPPSFPVAVLCILGLGAFPYATGVGQSHSHNSHDDLRSGREVDPPGANSGLDADHIDWWTPDRDLTYAHAHNQPKYVHVPDADYPRMEFSSILEEEEKTHESPQPPSSGLRRNKSNRHILTLKDSSSSSIDPIDNIMSKKDPDVLPYSLSFPAASHRYDYRDEKALQLDVKDKSISRRMAQIGNPYFHQVGQTIENRDHEDKTFAQSISMSHDGSMLAISGNIVLQTDELISGYVDVFRFNQETNKWDDLGVNITTMETGSEASVEVCLSGNGNRLAVAIILNDDTSSESLGTVKVYENNNGIWEIIGEPLYGGYRGDRPGLKVSLSYTGHRLVVGSRYYTHTVPTTGDKVIHVGLTKVFEYQSGAWEQIGRNLVGDSEGDYAGSSVALTPNGSILVVGATGDDSDGTKENTGRVKVYIFNENENIRDWQQRGNEIIGEAEDDESGFSVAVSETGSRVAVGAIYNDGNDGDLPNSGHVRVYDFNEGTGMWEKIGSDIDGDHGSVAEGYYFHVGDALGFSVSMSSDGNRLAIGAPFYSKNRLSGYYGGVAKLFEFSSNQWRQVANDLNVTDTDASAGYSVALSSNGKRFAIGIPSADVGTVSVYDQYEVSNFPSIVPSTMPSSIPSYLPSILPTKQPSTIPSSEPSYIPSSQPTLLPSTTPTTGPSTKPSDQPSTQPTIVSSTQPSTKPSQTPSSHPSISPSVVPTAGPSSEPSSRPSDRPSGVPSTQPTINPSVAPSLHPSPEPSSRPSDLPSNLPSTKPSAIPSAKPTYMPSTEPSSRPSITPSIEPTGQPSIIPSTEPSIKPSTEPSSRPSSKPSAKPTSIYSSIPSTEPSVKPSSQPSSRPSSSPSVEPTIQPSTIPSRKPSVKPSSQPSSMPSINPSTSGQPSEFPSNKPSTLPSTKPSNKPSSSPSVKPSIKPSSFPSTKPSEIPSTQPSYRPSTTPSVSPTLLPSTHPSQYPTSIEDRTFKIRSSYALFEKFSDDDDDHTWCIQASTFGPNSFLKVRKCSSNLYQLWYLDLSKKLHLRKFPTLCVVYEARELQIRSCNEAPPVEIDLETNSIYFMKRSSTKFYFCVHEYKAFAKLQLFKEGGKNSSWNTWHIEYEAPSSAPSVNPSNTPSQRPSPRYAVANFSNGFTGTAQSGSTITINAEANGGIGYTNIRMVVSGGTLSTTIHLWGAGGGGTKRRNDQRGGGGGYATGSYNFQPGTYHIVVGGAGEGGGESPQNNNLYQAYNTGGGRSGAYSTGQFDGSGGGGFTGVFSDSIAHSNSIIIAGGGGGGSGDPATGGGGGGFTGTNASNGNRGGRFGSQSGGGAGGSINTRGFSGSQLQGGDGGGPGAGGGGGYYGGGGGCSYGPGAGGGGSGYIGGVTGGSLTVGGVNAFTGSGYWQSNVGRGGNSGRRGGGGQITIVFNQSPSSQPSLRPSAIQTAKPSFTPRGTPTLMPTMQPSDEPTKIASDIPSQSPSQLPSILPTILPSLSPSAQPSAGPSSTPTQNPSQLPSILPTILPPLSPSAQPSAGPSSTPTQNPSVKPSAKPTIFRTNSPTIASWKQMYDQVLIGEAKGDNYGSSVSMSENGLRIAVGAYSNDGNGINSGHVRVFRDSGTEWTQVGNDINGEALVNGFGTQVSLSSDGMKLAVGAPDNKDNNGITKGSVRVFQDVDSNWIQMYSQDIDGEGEQDRFGTSVSISPDGSVLAIGAYGNDDSGDNAGHVRTYRDNNSQWVQYYGDLDGDSAGDWFGRSVSMSFDGKRMAVGAVKSKNNNGLEVGRVRVYEDDGFTWVHMYNQNLDGEDEKSWFGYSVSLSHDGKRLAVGAPQNTNGDGGIYSGHVRVFRDTSSNWEHMYSQDLDGEDAGDRSGTSVSISADGKRVAIGAWYNDNVAYYAGSVRVYEDNGFEWVHTFGQDIDGTATMDFFGASVAISGDGTRLVVGANGNDNANGQDAGHVRIYQAPSPPS